MRFIVLLGLTAMAGCELSFEGGANSHQQMPGNESGGVNVGVGDIAVSPTGDYLVTNVGALTILRPGFAPDPTGATMSRVSRSMKVAVSQPTRLAFAWSHDVFYVSNANRTLAAIDAKNGSVLWQATIPGDSLSVPHLDVSKDDRRVVYGSGAQLTVLDAADGKTIASIVADDVIEDVELLADGRAIVAPQHRWSGTENTRKPHTMVSIVSLNGDKPTQTIDVPNCTSNLVVSPDGTRAFLAPTTCFDPMPVVRSGHDPVSVIDLVAGRFVRNLPGFGPVAIAPDGKSVVAFMDAFNIDAQLFDDPKQIPDRKGPEFHMMVIDGESLRFRTAPIGDLLPRYAMTPDGKVLLVDTFWFSDVVRLFDTETLEIRSVDGPSMSLGNFVITPDSSHAYAIDHHALFSIDIPNATAEGFKTPDSGASPPQNQGAKGWSREHRPTFIPGRINISPDGKTLYLRASVVDKLNENLTNKLCVYSIERRDCTEWFSLP